MTNQKLEAVKDEVLNNAAQNYMIEWDIKGFKNTYPRLHKTIMEAMGEFHQRLLEEAGKEIRSNSAARFNPVDQVISVKQASALLAIKQGEIERHKSEKQEYIEECNERLKKVNELVSQLEAKDKEIVRYANVYGKTSMQLQESKAEVERLKTPIPIIQKPK